MTKFTPGQSGNPAGRPRGITDKRAELSKLLVPHAEALVNKVVELALTGDVGALRLCVERLIPKARGETLDLSLPCEDIENVGALLQNNTAVIAAVSKGELTIEQAQVFSQLLKTQHELIFSNTITQRITALEQVLEMKREVQKS